MIQDSFFYSDSRSTAGLRCITLAAVPLALFALQYTQIISFVMISPYYYISGSLSLLLLKKNRKKGSFLSLRKKKEKSNLTLSFSPTFASWSIFIFKVEVLAS